MSQSNASALTHEQALEYIPISAVRINGDTQSRVELSQATIEEYKDLILAGANFPPVVAYFDGASFWLADGFHRFHAHKDAGAVEILGDIRIGTLRDARLFSFGANGTHGLRRTNSDKRKAVTEMLSDSEWETWSQARIAQQCCVSVGFVSKLVSELSIHGEQIRPSVRMVERNGVTYEQNTAKIGKASAETIATPTSASPTEASSAVAPLPAMPSSVPLVAPSPVAATDPEGTLPEAVEIVAPGDTDGTPAASKMIEVDEEEYNELVADYKRVLAENTKFGDVVEADDQLSAAMQAVATAEAEIAKQKAIAASANQSLGTKMGENNELIRTVRRLTRDVERETKRADEAERQLAKMRSAA